MVANIVVGLVTGAVSSAIVACVFYWLSGRDLKHEATELRRLNVLLIRALHNSGAIEARFDDQGNPVGLIIKVSAAIGGKSGLSADLTKITPPEDDAS